MVHVPWNRAALGANVFRASVELENKNSWEAWALLSSDRHWDNPKSDRSLQKKHLEEAKKRGAVVIDCGDLFCAMQGKFDKRASKSSVRPEHQVDNYLDQIVYDAADWFAPYSENLLVVGHGNHESSIKKRVEVDLIERFVTLLSAQNRVQVFNGHFSGWVQFAFTNGKNSRGTKRVRNTITLHYDHGWGGGGPVTADMIQHQRRAVILPDADIVVSGHTHDAWARDFARTRLSIHGTTYNDVQTHIKMPTYKDDYGDGTGGWHAETGKPPKPLGAWWLRFYYSHEKQRVLHEAIRAN